MAAEYKLGLGTEMGTMAETGPIQGPRTSPHLEPGVDQTQKGKKASVNKTVHTDSVLDHKTIIMGNF